MSEEVKPREKSVEAKNCVTPKKAKNSPKTSQETWNAIKCEFEAGSYLSLQELASKYKVHPVTLRTRMLREKWNEKQRTLQNKVERVIEAKVLSLAEKQASYLERLSKRGEKYEALIDASLSQIGDLVDPDSIDSLTKSEIRIKELSCTGLRIPTLSGMDITSQGKSLGDSFVSAIAKLRESSGPKLGSDDLKKALDAEIVD